MHDREKNLLFIKEIEEKLTLKTQDRVPNQYSSRAEQLENTIIEEFGEDLGKVAIAYASRGHSSHGNVFFEGNQQQYPEIRTSFANVLAEEIVKQPTETRGAWLDGLLTAMDQRYPLTKKRK